MSKVCPNPQCGTTLPTNARFCYACGHQFVRDGEQSEKDKAQEQLDNEREASHKLAKEKKELEQKLAAAKTRIDSLEKNVAAEKDVYNEKAKGLEAMMEQNDAQKEEAERKLSGLKQEKKKLQTFLICTLLGLLCAIAVIVGVANGSDLFGITDAYCQDIRKLRDEVSSLNDTIINLHSQVGTETEAVRTVKKQCEDILRETAGKYPIILTDISIGCVDNYGEDRPIDLMDYYDYYLQPKIKYNAVKKHINTDAAYDTAQNTAEEDASVPLQIKIYQKDGNDLKYKCQYQKNITISESGEESLKMDASWWCGRGRFLCEVWCNGVCLKTKEFSVYDYYY